MNAFYLVTGTSRGIGEALAKCLLARGATVLGVSRTGSATLASSRYHDLAVDLAQIADLGKIVDRAIGIVREGNFDFLCLVNNASAVEPVGPIGNAAAADIDTHVRIGLTAPMVLSSAFVRGFAGTAARKKIAFMSSGAATTPLAHESVYCASKAGLQMFARCIGLEQHDIESGFEIISIGPGMVDTDMQLAVRSKSSDDFALADFFRQAHADGLLQDPDDVAQKISTILDERWEQGATVRVSDV